MDKTRMIKYVEQAATGDAKAIEALYKYTYPGAYSFAGHLCANENDVEDILQESYITAFSRLNTIRDRVAFPAWFKKIIVNTWRAYAKDKSNAYETAVFDAKDEYFEEGMYSESALDMVEISETNREIYGLVSELPENQRVCMILYYYEDMKVEEIAEALNIPVGSVKSRLYYGRQQLRRRMEERKPDSFSAVTLPAVPTVTDSAMFAKIMAALTAGSQATAARSFSAVTFTTAATTVTTSAATTTTTTSTEETAATTAALPTQPQIYASFDYRAEGDGVILIRYTGNESDVTVPEKIDGKTVTAIGDGAFKMSNVLRSVVIPSTVRRIGGSAFRECRNLCAVTLGSGVEEIGGSAFLGCSALQRLAIPSNVRSLGGLAFAHCTELAEVEAAQGVEVIGYAAFKGCTSLKSASLPESVRSIGDDTFDGAGDGFYITAPEGTYAYEYAALKGCLHLD